MPTYSSRKRYQSEAELESVATKPTIIDNLLSDYYDIEIFKNPTHLLHTDGMGSCYIHLTKGFLQSILKPKEDRVTYQEYANVLSYKFTVKFRPNKKYVQHLEGVYKLATYSVDLPVIPIDYFHSVYYYFNDNKNEFVTVVNQPKFDEKLKSFIYESVKNNTTIFQSPKMYGRVVDEIGKVLSTANIEYLLSNFQQSHISNYSQSKTRINEIEWKVDEVYKTFLNDLKSNDLPNSLRWYVGISEEEVIE